MARRDQTDGDAVKNAVHDWWRDASTHGDTERYLRGTDPVEVNRQIRLRLDPRVEGRLCQFLGSPEGQATFAISEGIAAATGNVPSEFAIKAVESALGSYCDLPKDSGRKAAIGVGIGAAAAGLFVGMAVASRKSGRG